MTTTRKERLNIMALIAVMSFLGTVGPNLAWKIYDSGMRRADDERDHKEFRSAIAILADSTARYHEHFEYLFRSEADNKKRLAFGIPPPVQNMSLLIK